MCGSHAVSLFLDSLSSYVAGLVSSQLRDIDSSLPSASKASPNPVGCGLNASLDRVACGSYGFRPCRSQRCDIERRDARFSLEGRTGGPFVSAGDPSKALILDFRDRVDSRFRESPVSDSYAPLVRAI